jgi:hypothetical protein
MTNESLTLTQQNVPEPQLLLLKPHIPDPDYVCRRRAEYPDMKDYLDAIVKNDQNAIDKYIADCQAVKAKYPKPTE